MRFLPRRILQSSEVMRRAPTNVAALLIAVAAVIISSLQVNVGWAETAATDLLVVYGNVYHPDGVTYWQDGRTLTITNRNTGATGGAWIGAMETGKYEVVLLGIEGGFAANDGDTLVVDINGGVLHGPIFRLITAEDVSSNLIQWDLVAHVIEAISVPQQPSPAELRPNFPNPFNPRTKISFFLTEPGPVLLTLHDLRGQRLVTLAANYYTADEHSVMWDGMDSTGRSMPSGVYLVRLKTAGNVLTRKIVLAR